MNSIGYSDTGIAPKDSIERYMTSYQRASARQGMQEALFLLRVVQRVTGRVRRIPAAIREALGAARAQRLGCDRHGAAHLG
jgi:hypothetical protein